MAKKIHIVPHFHWDREWYFTTSRSKIYLMKDLGDVLNTLEKDPEFKYFMLDAQGSLLDDYIKWRPEDEARIKRLVQAHRLVIGPWYTQSDLMVISAESIVRNMYYGMKTCLKYGPYMNVGYVPDSFGMAGNMPQIYNAFGIKDTLFWRGVTNDMVKHTDYNWRGHDGSTVFVTQIPYGYYIGGNIPEGDEDAKKFWKNECLIKAGTGATDNIYFPNGFDQAPIRRNLVELVKKQQEADPENTYVISCIKDYIKDVKAAHPELEEVEGELILGKHSRVHKSIFSSRSDLKALNTKLQNYVTHVLEPLMTMSYSLGNEYPHGPMETIWKLLFENAAHDSIGSCISDTANEDVYMRYKQVRDIADALVELHTRLIATSIKNNADMTITLFNTLPFVRDEVVTAKVYLPGTDFALKNNNGNDVNYTILESKDLTDYVLSQTIKLNPSKKVYTPESVIEATIAIAAKNLPAMGYVQYTLDFSHSSKKELKESTTVENEFYSIHLEEDGTLTIVDKTNNHVYKHQAVFEENGDGGDSFNYSPAHQDLLTYSKEHLVDSNIQASDLYAILNAEYKLPIPSDLEERALGKRSIELPVKMSVSLRKGSPVIDFDVHVDNVGKSHRLCVVFDADLVSKVNIADEQFGAIERENVHEKEMALYNAALERSKTVKEEVNNDLPLNFQQSDTTWQEPPISIEPTQSFVSLSNSERGIALIPQGVREYEVIDDYAIRLTLFRTYSFMGKENLIYRPGRASGERIIETRDAELQKPLDFSFGFTTFAGDFNSAHIANTAKAYNTPVVAREYSEFLNGRLIFSEPEVEGTKEDSYSLFSTENKLVVSAIKKAEDKDGYIIRLYNGQFHKEESDTLVFTQNIKKAYYVDLKEEYADSIEVVDNTIQVKPLTHCKFTTIYVETE